MSSFPGENTDIPKRLLEALESQPLNHLIPKAGLFDIIGTTVRASMPPDRNAFSTPLQEVLNQSRGISLDQRKSKYVFRRPKNKSSMAQSGSNKKIIEGLSPLAKECLAATGCEVNHEDIKFRLESQGNHNLKHKLESNDTVPLNFNPDSKMKKVKIESSETVNQAALAKRYIEDLIIFLDEVVKDYSAEWRNIEHWYSLPNKNFVLTENCIAKLQISMNNVLAAPTANTTTAIKRLVKLLDILVLNIKISEEFGTNGSQKDLLNRVAHASVSLIFTIFLLAGDDKRVSLEHYLLTPLDFIESSFKNIKHLLSDQESLKNELNLLHQSILLLPVYINRRPFLDKGIITKLIYTFTDFVMENGIDAVNNSLSLQYCKDKVTSMSIDILESLFAKLPDQRELIIEELLSNAEKLPTKRVQKKLKKLENEIYVTDFTVAILLFLENINCYHYAETISVSDDGFVTAVADKHIEETRILNAFANHLTESIFERFVKSTSGYRHVIENYVQDLLALLPYPQWCVAQDLLTSITRKLLLAFDPSHPYSTSVETVCLHLLGSIGLSIFEIKCNTNPENANNLVKLFNSPNYLPLFLKSFEKCSEYLCGLGKQSANRYLWHKKLAILLKLDEYGTDAQTEGKINLSYQEIKNLAEQNSNNSKTMTKLNFSEVRNDYFSILHALELLHLYEPYLKLILSILGKDKVKLKSTAIKCLSMLANADQNVLKTPVVKNTIGRTLKDSSASVKAAVLDLISIGSSYLQYYQQLNINYDDESISIRKQVLRINGSIYDETDSLDVKIFVASKILLKIEDEEDNIIEIARNMLLERWILSMKDEESLLDQRSGLCNDILTVMSSVATSNSKCSQLFECYLNFYLLNEQMHSQSTYERIIKSFRKLTDYLVQHVVELQSMEVHEKNNSTKQKLLILLSKFSDCSETFITKDHIIALYPYIVSDEKSEWQFHILRVFNRTMQHLSNFKPKFLCDLETTLLSRLPRMNVKEIGEAMPLIWCIATSRKDTGRVTKACSSCFQHLSPYIYQANKNPGSIIVESKLQRLIYLSAAFARFCKFPRKESKPIHVQDDEPVHEYVAKCLLLLSRPGTPHVIRRISIKALTQLCGDHPKLFNSKHILNLLDEEFESNNMDMKLVILESFYDFFVAEEHKSLKQSGVNVSISSHVAPGKQSSKKDKNESISGDGICAALVTRFLKHLLKICLSPDIRSSLVAVRLLKLILQYGYTNPSHCIPTIIALSSSTNCYLHAIGTEVLSELFEKYETMVFAGISQGVKITVEYLKTLEENDYYKNNTFLRNLQMVMGNSKKNSTKFFKCLARILKLYFSQILVSGTESETKEGILFLTNNISELTFSSQYELMFLLKVIDLESAQLEDAISDNLERKEEPDQLDEKVRNNITIQFSLQELKEFFLSLYGLKPDLIGETEESELRSKLLPPISAQSRFGEKLKLIIAQANKHNPNDLSTKDKELL
ncbi:SCC2 (YDR180W) [Zygosaccharomyces parabailii]|nr:SCC2 (YDR180W) [Zygosaccharomyces parabailii]